MEARPLSNSFYANTGTSTMNAMAYNIFQQVVHLVFTPKCFENYFIDFNFTNGKIVLKNNRYRIRILFYFSAMLFGNWGWKLDSLGKILTLIQETVYPLVLRHFT